MTRSLQIQDQNFVLHPTGAMFWEEKSMLLISDVHLGKISHFRKFGAAVPQKAIRRNFDLLDKVISMFHPKTVCFMGDLFHSSLNAEWTLFENWMEKMEAKCILVSGNHDIISPSKYEALGFQVADEIKTDGFLLTHHPEERVGFFNLSGHVHPAIKLRGNGKQTLRLACFFKQRRQMILPAFGEFTGSYTMKARAENEIFAIADDSIFKVEVQ